ncbi:hypothetical protein ACQ4PT_040066 [Festuca glaucescens]
MAPSPVLAHAVLPPPITRFHNIEESPAPVPAPAVLPPPITRFRNVEESPVLVPAPAILPPPITSYIRFRNVEELHTYSRSWETTARIISRRIRYTRNGDVMYRGILADQSGDKMEAVAYGQQANHFNNELRIGEAGNNYQDSSQAENHQVEEVKMGSTDITKEKVMENNIRFTEIKDYIRSFPPKTKLVWIHDACLKRVDLECLFKDDGWLDGDLINAYIYYLRAQEHLNNRAGGQVWLDSTHVSGILKRDGEFPISSSEHDKIVARALIYIQHDMLLVPVNVKEAHWYLCNVDAPNRRVQVLDSFGSRMSRPDLELTLQGLENHLKIASQISGFNKDEKWPDLEVTNWPWEECIHEPMQSDGSSCGLFLLKLMEHWTGHELAHAVTQKGIKLFRKKLPIILLASVLNDLKGTPEYEQPDVKVDTSDVVVWDKNDPPPTEVSQAQASEVANDPPPSLKMPKMSINKNELVSKLRSYILSIDDKEAMKEIWVQSSKPYPISLSLKQLKDLLNDTRGIDTDSFNMAVRINATDEFQWVMDTPCHYMDLQFCNILTNSTRDPKLRLPFDTQRDIIARMFDCWPGMCFHVSSCNSILIPYRTTGRFILFVFNLGERTITILDPIPVPDKWKTSLLNKDALKLKDISFHLNIALQAAIQGWNDDIFLWCRITPVGLPKNHDSNMSGFWVLKFMRSWNVHVQGGYDLRNKVVVHMLTYKDNECEANIPQVVKDLVKFLGTDFFV